MEGYILLLHSILDVSPLYMVTLKEEESRHNAIDVGCVVVVVHVAVVVDIHEVSRVRDVRRPLPPVVRNDPTARTHTNNNRKYSEHNLLSISYLISLNLSLSDLMTP